MFFFFSISNVEHLSKGFLNLLSGDHGLMQELVEFRNQVIVALLQTQTRLICGQVEVIVTHVITDKLFFGQVLDKVSVAFFLCLLGHLSCASNAERLLRGMLRFRVVYSLKKSIDIIAIFVPRIDIFQ